MAPARDPGTRRAMIRRAWEFYRRAGRPPQALFTDCAMNLAHHDIGHHPAGWGGGNGPGRYGGPVLFGADDSFSPFLGDDLLVYLVLAMGAALVAGNLAAILRPPERANRGEGELDQAPVKRSLVMAGIGLVAALWALISLLAN